jgi:putative ATP-dependent endonuclease of OLD family
MRLDRIRITNFRSFDDAEIVLAKDLTLFVGENNSGKSNAIDAIRLMTRPLSGRRDTYAESTDIRFGSIERVFEIEAVFTDLNPSQQGRFISAAQDTTLESVTFGLTYDASTNRYPIRPTMWAGSTRGAPEAGCQDMLRHVYLPPLRDAKRALASGNPTRIYSLVRHFLEDEDPDDLARRLERSADDPVLRKVDCAVEAGLSALTSGVRKQVASLGFATDEKLIDIARDLRFKLADDGIKPEDLRYSGHGLANLLYIASITVELERVDNADLTLFLVEEPEAHLHPQLQASVLGFLEDQATQSTRDKDDLDGPAGEIQIVVATHSPNLSAWVDTKKLVFFRSSSATSSPQVDQSPEGIAIPRPATRCIPVSRLNLTDPDRRKIDRYLDVTRSSLMFGGRVLLVEGIAEALLVPIIAREFVLSDNPQKLRLFRSAVFVPINGVDFAPYVRLLLSSYTDARIADRVVVITDGDRRPEHDNGVSPGEQRTAALEKMAKDLNAAAYFSAFANTYSLETELISAGNGQLMKEAYLELHQQSESKWDDAAAKTGIELAMAVQKLFGTTRKGDFAQLLADRICCGSSFQVPSYLRSAIEALVK